MVYWLYGLLVIWFNGYIVYWLYGLMVIWFADYMDYWLYGLCGSMVMSFSGYVV